MNTQHPIELLFPPRPEFVITPEQLALYDNEQYLAQQKSNGSYGLLYLFPDGYCQLYNRHKEKLTLCDNKIEFAKLHRGNGEMILCGEYLNKNKKTLHNQPFNHKYILFDLIKFNGSYLHNTTFEYRMQLLENLYPCEQFKINLDSGIEHEPYLCNTSVKNIYRCDNIKGNFKQVFENIIQVDYVEGLVLKRKNGLLQYGFSPNSNSSWQIKIRKQTKNYKF